MEYFKQWTICICISLILAVIFSSFEPEGRMKSFYKLLVGLFVFFSFIYPIKNIKHINFDKSLSHIESSALEINSNAYANTVNNEINNFLKSEGFEGVGTVSDVYINSENEIIITSVTVSVPDEYDKKEIEKLLLDKLGIKAKVINKGE